MKRALHIFSFLFIFYASLNGQDYLHTEGKFIYDADGEEVILRGLGTGNWMLQEGYMMQTDDLGGTHHEFRERLTETIGEAKTDSFYNAWLQYHFTRTDVDSMKSWGYNSVRVAMHYKWFTPPIEDEPVEGEITWRDKGFELIDSVLNWCEDNQMYLILDLHGAPGGQGEDANISDYDPSKPSLWESDFNKDKTVALWAKLADRYADEPWIGGYDLINETNWTFSEGNNAPLRELYERITDAIREVDQNHIIFIEGNGFANDFSGLTPPWDDNMVYSFHKYWNYNDSGSLDWVLELREDYNIPLWLGETGENSNTWFTNLVELCEKNRIGWSWWPVKKPGINNPLRVEVNEGYSRLLDYWRGEGAEVSENEAFEAVLKFAENHKIENCFFRKDVVDAKMRQPHTTETKSFVQHKVGDRIYFSDFDLGRVNYAYYDNDTANYHLEQGHDFTSWNNGWAYRNDGVDIEACNDDPGHTNGYNVGWTEDGEWMQYTVTADSIAAWQLNIRYAAGSDGLAHLEIDGEPVTKEISFPGTGGYQEWQTLTVNDIILPEGEFKIRFKIDRGGINLNYFSFSEPAPIQDVGFEALMAEVGFPGDTVRLYLNRSVSGEGRTFNADDFSLESDGETLQVSEVIQHSSHSRRLDIVLDNLIGFEEDVVLSYSGQSVFVDEQNLEHFSELPVMNNLPLIHALPGKIEAEDFSLNQGFELEYCADDGGGHNTAYADAGDFVEYNIEVAEQGTYLVDYRVATERASPRLVFQIEEGGDFVPLDTMTFSQTGGWQNWETQSGEVELPAGRYKIRLVADYSEYNLNWFDISVGSFINEDYDRDGLTISPVPASDYIRLEVPFPVGGGVILEAYDLQGKLVKKWEKKVTNPLILDVNDLQQGYYLLLASWSNRTVLCEKFIIL